MATTYITPTGSGDKSGSSWANAATITNLDAMVKKAGVGGSVFLAADKGDYLVKAPISVFGSGVTITGINTNGKPGEAHFVGTRATDWTAGAATGNELFRIQKGANDLVFQNMQIDNTGTAFKVGGDVKNLTVQHIDADNVQRFFENYVTGSNTTATIAGLKIRDIDVTGFSKNAIRLQYDTNNVLIENVRGDSERQDGDNFAMGVHLTDTVHNVTLRKVTMENATQDRGEGLYWNADGFASERGTYNVTFEDTVARGNTDGGYDLKSSNLTMIRALAEDNGRNYRFWGTDVKVIDSVGLNPHVRGGNSSQAQVWLDDGAKVKIVNSTFTDAGSKTKVFDNAGSLELVNTTVKQAIDALTFTGKTPAGLVAGLVTKVASVGTNSLGVAYSDGSAVHAFTQAPTVVVAPGAPAGTPTGTGAIGGADWIKVRGTAASDIFSGTTKAESFIFDSVIASGTDTIRNFGANDLVVLNRKLADSNGDGIVTAGKDGIYDLGTGGGKLIIEGLAKGLRLLGETADGFVYGDSSVWKAGAVVPTAVAATKNVSSAANDVFLGTNARDTFYFDNTVKTGSDQLLGFGKNDVIVTSRALKDGNNDGFIVPGGQGLDLGDGASLVKSIGVSKAGLRYLGQDDQGHVYADGAVRPKGALEGKLVAADTLSGGKTDTKADVFFFDTALHRQTGADAVANFGAKDVIVTTSALGTGAVGSKLVAVGGAFALVDGGDVLGSFAVKDVAGGAVSAIEYDGMRTVNGVDYFVYSSVGSAAGVDALTF